MNVDPREIRALAFLAVQECTRAGKPWNGKGVESQIRGAVETDGRPVDLVLTAAYAAAHDESAQTPAAIRWPERYPSSAPGTSPAEPTCTTCSKPERLCRAEPVRASARHEFTTGTPEEPEHTLPWRDLVRSIAE